MVGVVLAVIGSFFSEIFDLIGKVEIKKKEEGIFMMAFLSFFLAPFWFLVLIIYRGEFLFSIASLPTFTFRLIFEIFQVYITILAISKSERSTFGFVRTLTIPLLLIVDLFLGYSLSNWQIGGIILISLALFILFLNHGVKKRGLGLVFLSALGSVVTVSLYKYNITNFNSVEAEQFVLSLLLAILFFFLTIIFEKRNPLRLIFKPALLIQAMAVGFGGTLHSLAFVFAPASVVTAAIRSGSVFWSLISGRLYFHEKKLILKITSFVLILIGMFLFL